MVIMLKPINNNIVLKPEEKEDVTANGVIKAGREDPKPVEKGEVVALNKGCDYLEVGQKVLYKYYSGDEVVVDELALVIVDESDIIAIVS